MSMATRTDTCEQIGWESPGGESMLSLPPEQVELLDGPLPRIDDEDAGRPR